MVLTYLTIDITNLGERLFSLGERIPYTFYSVNPYSFLMIDMKREIKELPDELELPSNESFGGLFTSRTKSALIEEFISDPYHIYRPKELAELLETSYPTLRAHFSNMVDSGLILKDTSDPSRPRYKMNCKSKRLSALSLLMDAINDDRDGTDTMDRSISKYYGNHLVSKHHDVRGAMNISPIQAKRINGLTINGQKEKYPITLSKGSA
jgi:hypothetical protein